MTRSALLSVSVLAALSSAVAGVAASGVAPLLRAPLWVDRDDKTIPEPPERRASEIFDTARNTWLRHLNVGYDALRLSRRPALNVNAWDEVPDSSWFTNRIGRRAVARAELLTGPPGAPPQPGTWRVRSVKTEGYTPGIQVRDETGRTYFLKFDITDAPERNSAAEKIGSLIMHAAGYNVPYYSIVYFRPEDLTLAENAAYEDALGRKRPMTANDVESALSKLSRRPDGRIRAVASLFLPGKGKGRFPYYGTRKDDPNDLIPHELRRELRGLRVIGSWFNHADTKEVNTYDSFVTEDGRSFLRHYFIDFGSSMGSGNFVNGPCRVGFEYIFDGPSMTRSLVTLGAFERPWEASCEIAHVEVGRFEGALFDAASWKPNYPNLAFEEMDASDAYWGAKIVTAFDDDLVRALAEAGDYSRPEVTRFVEETFRERRNKIGRHAFDLVSPLEDFQLSVVGDRWTVTFRDLGVERGFALAGERSYRFDVKEPGRLERTLGSGESRAVGSINLVVPRTGNAEPADRFGRNPLAVIDIRSNRRPEGMSLPVRVVMGREGESADLQVLGWSHDPR